MDPSQLTALAEPIVKSSGFDLVLLSFEREKSGLVLRLLIEKSGCDPLVDSGVDLKSCSAISRQFGELLEAGDLIDKQYTLEVSSPGIERPLTCPQDFVRFSGRKVKIRTRAPIDGKKRFTGILEKADETIVRVKLDPGSKTVDIPMELITRANLVYIPKRI
jgi:ribosome maturation factor RimP